MVYYFIILLIIGLGLISPAQVSARHFSSLELIEKAYRDGEIGYKEALNYKVTAVFRPMDLPVPFRSKIPIKSATHLLREAMSKRHLLTPENERFLARGRGTTLITLYRSGIELLSHVSPAEHFSIHYTVDNKNGDAVPTTDINSDGVPDYVERFANILDYVWKKEIEEMGYDAPPSDNREGGDCLLDVYLADLNAYGYTYINEGDPASMVFMVFDNDFSPTCPNTTPCFPPNSNPGGNQEGAMMVAAAHEFSHTIQFQITDDIPLNGWWMEASATWMEDHVYPDVNDYINYIDYWFEHPELPLNIYCNDILDLFCPPNDPEVVLFPYGTAIWVKHLIEKYGSKFTYDVWKMIKDGDSALSAVERVLTERGTTLAAELKELRVANVTMTYEDGPIYKTWWDEVNPDAGPIGVTYEVDMQNFTLTDDTYNSSLNPLSARYYSFSAPDVSGYLNIDFDGGGSISVMVIGMHPDDTGYDVTEILTDNNNNGSIAINGFSNSGPYSRVVISPINRATTAMSNFTLTVSYTTTASAGNAASAASIDIEPDTTSLITGDAGISGRQQYYLIMFEDSNGNQAIDSSEDQFLESGTVWETDPSLADKVAIDQNGFAIASDAVTTTITAYVGALSPVTATLSAGNPAAMLPGILRDCTIRHSDGRCFIATAAFGSPLHPYVGLLREFRDRFMLTNTLGRWIVSLYYLYSPPLAEKIEKNENLREIVKILLIPVIISSGLMVKTTIAEKIIVGIIGMIILIMKLVAADFNYEVGSRRL